MPEPAVTPYSLYRWQLDALAAWAGCGRRGIVEAVTGSGKTNLALAAIIDARRRGLFVLVVVPSRVLMEQWYERLTESLPDTRIGRLGDSSFDKVKDHDVLVTTRHSAAARQPLPPNEAGGLLVADECHGFGGGVLRKSLLKAYQERLGLTATLERSDDAVDTVILPYFGGVCFRYDFAMAIRDGVCAQPRVAFVAVPLTAEERDEYISTESTLVAARSALRKIPGMPQEPFGDFLAAVGYLAKNDAGPGGKAANDYLDSFSKRREIVASSSAKYEVLSRFAPSIEQSDGALLFTETVRAANHAINRLDPVVNIEIITGETPRKDRERILGDLRTRALHAVAAPRVLDEGVDVPDANLGIVVSASRTRRQMIQRMGRILRRKRRGSGARFVIIFASDTLEDPTISQERDGFVEEIEGISEDARVFAQGNFADLANFLDYDGPDTIVEPEFIGPLEGRDRGDLDAVTVEALRAGDADAWVTAGSHRSAWELANEALAPGELYAWCRYVDWGSNGWFRDEAERIRLPEPDDAAYIVQETPMLPELTREKKPKVKKRLSTGDNPMAVINVDGQFVIQCTGCGAHSEPVPYRWQALEQTVECTCDD